MGRWLWVGTSSSSSPGRAPSWRSAGNILNADSGARNNFHCRYGESRNGQAHQQDRPGHRDGGQGGGLLRLARATQPRHRQEHPRGTIGTPVLRPGRGLRHPVQPSRSVPRVPEHDGGRARQHGRLGEQVLRSEKTWRESGHATEISFLDPLSSRVPRAVWARRQGSWATVPPFVRTRPRYKETVKSIAHIQRG